MRIVDVESAETEIPLSELEPICQLRFKLENHEAEARATMVHIKRKILELSKRYSDAAIARSLGISRQWVWQMRREAEDG